jgi:hypothetical protein
VDLLEGKGVSRGVCQEGLPFSGFQGDLGDQGSGRNDYVRKYK